jgi:two-component system sensor histidine kinase VicK
VSISDNGIGIPKKYHAGLFEKFTRARRPGLHEEASHGLGMSIIKSIIDWHHGQIRVESSENEGTTFYIRLPLAT